MTIRNMITTGVTATLIAASTTFAMAQATSTGNNATTGSEMGSGAKSGMQDKGAPGAADMQGMKGGEMKGDAKGSMGSMKGEKPTSAGTSENQVKDLRGHSETPTTGAK